MSDTMQSKEFARRTIIKGAAWSVPVIAVAAAAPSYAASGAIITPASFAGQCYQSGNNFGFSFTLTSSTALTITAVASLTPGYAIDTNHENLFYFSGASTVVGKLPNNGAHAWNLAANSAATITVPVLYTGGSKWPGYPTGPGGHGTDAFTLQFTAKDAANQTHTITVTFSAGYDLPNPGGAVNGSCPPNSAPGGKEWFGTAGITATYS